MKREILFRGLRTDGKGWVYGYYFFNGSEHGIIDNKAFTGSWVEVIPESVGQYTGKDDMKGTKIFEGDNFNPDLEFDEVESVVRWDEDGSKFVVDSYGHDYSIGEGGQEIYHDEISLANSDNLSDIGLEYNEVIGNIHQTK